MLLFFFFFPIFTTIISILICHFRESSPSLFCRIAAGACDFPLCYKYSHCYSMPKPTNTLTARAPQLRDCTLLRVQVSLKNLKVFLWVFLSDSYKSSSSSEEEVEERISVMGAKKSSSSFSFCGMFKACFSSSKDDYYCNYDDSSRRHFASDEDRGRWVAEPGIDRKASAFIARFYASRVSDSEHQIASWNFKYQTYMKHETPFFVSLH